MSHPLDADPLLWQGVGHHRRRAAELLGIPIRVDASLPPRVIEIRDPGTHEVLGRIRLRNGNPCEMVLPPERERAATPIYAAVADDLGLDPLGLI